MKKTNYLLSITTGVGLTLGMIGCGGDTIDEPLPSQTQNVPARMVAVYSPAAGDIPVPNDLLFGGTQDLTINVPDLDEEDYSNPLLAVSSLDGWSATAPFSISFNSALDSTLSVDPASVVAGSSVRLYKVNTLRPEVIPGSGIIAPTGPVTDVIRELTSPADYVVQATSATTIAIIPTTPFEQQGAYMVVLTNGLQDSDGEVIIHDAEYAIAQSRNPIDPESSVAGLEPVRQLVNAMENAAAAAEGGPAVSDIILSYQFTVQSIGNVMQTAKAVYIDGAIGAGLTPVTNFNNLGLDTTPFTGLPTSAANLYTGDITLNYMLSAPTTENPTAPLNTFWRTAANVPDGQGGSFPNPDPLGNLTYANPLPQVNGVETVPLLVSIPKSAECPMPYPIAIFQHGITQNRTNLIAIADALAEACTAGIAMDLPLHGLTALDGDGNPNPLFEGYDAGTLRERTFGIDFISNTTGAPGSDGTPDPSGAHTINLSNLLVARDNTRQAIFDLLYLEKAIAFMDIDGDDVTDFDSDNISYIGHSLGGIVGTGVLAYSDNIKAAGLANPGGGIALMLDASEVFGPQVRAGVAAGAGLELDDPALPGVLAQFYFATQTVLDSSDPVNTAAHAVSNGVPTLLLQVADDDSIPNSVATAPLSGTEPLARALYLTTLVAATDDTGPVSGPVQGERFFTKLNDGLHETLLSPADPRISPDDTAGLINVTTEMQSQIVSFLASGGTLVDVTDPTLLAQ